MEVYTSVVNRRLVYLLILTLSIDIVVGAFRSEKAVVLRSKPVATIVATLELTPKTLVYLTTNQ